MYSLGYIWVTRGWLVGQQKIVCCVLLGGAAAVWSMYYYCPRDRLLRNPLLRQTIVQTTTITLNRQVEYQLKQCKPGLFVQVFASERSEVVKWKMGILWYFCFCGDQSERGLMVSWLVPLGHGICIGHHQRSSLWFIIFWTGNTSVTFVNIIPKNKLLFHI